MGSAGFVILHYVFLFLTLCSRETSALDSLADYPSSSVICCQVTSCIVFERITTTISVLHSEHCATGCSR